MARMVAQLEPERKRAAEPRPTAANGRRLGFCLAILFAAAALFAAGCDNDRPETRQTATTPDRPAPDATDFPAAEGRSLDDVIKQADPPENTDPVITPASQVFYPGQSRYSFTLAERDHDEVTDAEVALYIAPIPEPGSGGSAYDQPAAGPFPARLVSLATDREFRSSSTAENPYAATAFYMSEIPFPRAGDWRVEALIHHRGRLIAKSLPRASVGAYRGIPRAGQRPPRISTPTAAGAAGETAGLTTRRPPGNLNEANFAEVLGERPVALLFTTPAFCQSRICGPVTDVAEQVKSELGGKVEVIQMEIYNDNDPDHGVRRQVRRFNLPSDTWLFVAGADGRLRQAVEGPFGVGEMRRWLEEADGG